MSRLRIVSNKIDLIFEISLFVFYYVENLKSQRRFVDFFLSKEKFNILWLCWKTRRRAKTNFGRLVINFSLISEPDKKRNTVNSVLDGLSSTDVKHSEGREARLDKWPIQCSIAGCEGWHYLDYSNKLDDSQLLLLNICLSGWHNLLNIKRMKNNYLYHIYIYLIFRITLSNYNIPYLLWIFKNMNVDINTVTIKVLFLFLWITLWYLVLDGAQYSQLVWARVRWIGWFILSKIHYRGYCNISL